MLHVLKVIKDNDSFFCSASALKRYNIIPRLLDDKLLMIMKVTKMIFVVHQHHKTIPILSYNKLLMIMKVTRKILRN